MVAWLIDYVISLALLQPGILVALSKRRHLIGPHRRVLSGTFPSPLILGGLALFTVYSIASVALLGTTLGRRAVGLLIVHNDGEGSRPGWRTAFLRHSVHLALTVLGIFVAIPGSVLFLVPFGSFLLVQADPMKRSLNDRIANTFVVERRS